VAKLKPDYLGFIFYDGSPRNYDILSERLTHDILKVGVFVDASVERISEAIKTHQLDVIQLHGNETPEFCQELSKKCDAKGKPTIELWKVFSVKDSFNFEVLEAYEGVVDKFLFDTKGKAKGGNGYTFDWAILKEYPSKKPFILSGGIGLDELQSVKEILKTRLPIYAIDVNSKFEIKPGLKDISALKKLQHEL
jgi:phosphoribosylanthranilate isomerase